MSSRPLLGLAGFSGVCSLLVKGVFVTLSLFMGSKGPMVMLKSSHSSVCFRLYFVSLSLVRATLNLSWGIPLFG